MAIYILLHTYVLTSEDPVTGRESKRTVRQVYDVFDSTLDREQDRAHRLKTLENRVAVQFGKVTWHNKTGQYPYAESVNGETIGVAVYNRSKHEAPSDSISRKLAERMISEGLSQEPATEESTPPDSNIKEVKFTVIGGFDIPANLAPEYDNLKTAIIGYTLPDGRIARPCVALEIESADGKEYIYVTSEKAMTELGFTNLDYDNSKFEEEDIS